MRCILALGHPGLQPRLGQTSKENPSLRPYHNSTIPVSLVRLAPVV